ncbi:hypothetical protein HOU02_gp303 [Caulobacter phage CcrBL9]|uniref:Uncharacterized protein n=1 Tax=Caulobacter phage CcrBL9 TaxID=2283270 RepID=A0A385EF06_9CAUD|nr:hypothetical protein HOU02_gp303 [Caulobacter phage CcrBL9]AXQ69422.1 hypothetical protein CcrBL9_gp398 [Caulobacter phage CcrBL9]
MAWTWEARNSKTKESLAGTAATQGEARQMAEQGKDRLGFKNTGAYVTSPKGVVWHYGLRNDNRSGSVWRRLEKD